MILTSIRPSFRKESSWFTQTGGLFSLLRKVNLCFQTQQLDPLLITSIPKYDLRDGKRQHKERTES